jgi:hypothetical protein
MPGSFNAWSPALVSWYSGPGWIGWAPIGRGGRASCTFGAAGCLTALPPGALRSGEPIRAGNPHVLHPVGTESVTAISRPEVAPGRVTISSGQSPSRIAPPASGFSRGGAAAPSTVVIGQGVTQGALVGHHSSGSGKEPIHVRLGGTMGGQLPTTTAAGVAAVPRVGGESRGARGATSIAGGPQILPHGSNGSPSRAVGGLGAGVRGGGASPGMVGSGGASSGSSHASGSSPGGSAPAGSAGGHH